MRVLRAAVVLVLALALPAPVSAADFQAGLDAHERGDYATALEELRPLAERGDGRAQYFLGSMYFYGAGVPRDVGEAVRWYYRAAERGDGRAQIQLGTMYENGVGLPQDYVLSHMWFNLAATHLPADLTDLTQDLGALNRDQIEKLMTPEQIAEAQRLEREWKPK